jgi:starch-binding outer membrane protein, SusD/RagB family
MNSRSLRRTFGVVVPVACLALVSGCDRVMDTQPFGNLNTGTYYRSASDFESATIGAYSTFQNLTALGRENRTLFRNALLADDDTRSPGDNNNNDVFIWSPGEENFGTIWDYSYRGILRANLIIDQLDRTTLLTDAEKARFGGEAKFVRAFFYFLLARHYGAEYIPLHTAIVSSLEATRAPAAGDAARVWDLIEQDLKDGVAGLPETLPAGRATRFAAQAMLGKVQVYRAQYFNQPAKYTEAATNLQAVVSSGRYSLVAYQNNFRHTTENNAESLFEMQASYGTDINGWAPVDENGGGASSGSGRHLATGTGGRSGINAPGGFDWGDGGIQITRSLVGSFEKYDSMLVNVPGSAARAWAVTRDPRAYFTFYSSGEQYGRACPANASGVPVPYNFVWSCSGGTVRADSVATDWWSNTGHTPAKYIRPYENFSDASGQNLNQSVSRNNERIIRYADVLLLLAEAKIEGPQQDLAGAAALINQVRARARNAWDVAYGAQSADRSCTLPSPVRPTCSPTAPWPRGIRCAGGCTPSDGRSSRSRSTASTTWSAGSAPG